MISHSESEANGTEVPRGSISRGGDVSSPVQSFQPEASASAQCALTSADTNRTDDARDTAVHAPATLPSGPITPLPPIPPIPSVSSYLSSRTPTPHFSGELPLYITLPTALRQDLRILLGTRPGGGAFGALAHLINDGLSVQSAARKVHPQFSLHCSIKRFRAQFDLWRKTGDWVSLVNRSKAGADWQDRDDGLPEDFLRFCAQRFCQYKRDDAKRQALNSIKRQFLTGRNDRGQVEAIPGYGAHGVPASAGRSADLQVGLPPGWSYSNILRQIRARNLFPRSVRALSHEGTAAARAFLPHALGTRVGLRFMEKIQFDDVKTDWRIFDDLTGTVCDLWLLIARDLATNILLGFGIRPARAREDGSQEHLKLRDTKQLLGWLLERFGLPPYLMHWVFERGTTTIAEATADALYELLGEGKPGSGRVLCHWTGMEGSNSPAGYAERRLGNPRAKGSLESTNRLMHTIGSNLPGQTGPIYTRRPQDLVSREKEAVQIWQLAQLLPERIRDQVRYPFATLHQARAELVRIFAIQNNRTDHELEGFEYVIEQREQAPCLRRKESPIERAQRLISLAPGKWDPVSPEVIAAFYEFSQRKVFVQDNGEIKFPFEGDRIIFTRPLGTPALIAGTALLAYYHREDPRFLYLTDGRGQFVGTWIRRDRAADPDALADSIRYTNSAMKAARDQAAALAAPERAHLDAMRAHNAQLLESNTFVQIQPINPSSNNPSSSPLAAALTSTASTREALKQRAADQQKTAADARSILMQSDL